MAILARGRYGLVIKTRDLGKLTALKIAKAHDSSGRGDKIRITTSNIIIITLIHNFIDYSSKF
jgi:hypothetical protein